LKSRVLKIRRREIISKINNNSNLDLKIEKKEKE
jgi:hypothetical protein